MRSARFNLLIDLNGTCHIGDTPTLGAVQAIQRLRAVQQQQPDRVKIRFCSNTSKESSSSLLSRLRRVGLGVELVGSSDVFTSLDAAYRLVARQKLRPLLLLSQSAQTAFRGDDALARDCFFAHADLDPERLDAQNAAKLRSCDAVVLGLCPELMTSKWLDEAFRLLAGEYDAKQRVALITTHRALYHRPTQDGPLSLGPGAFVAALEAASGRRASETIVCGKPQPAFLQECVAGMIGVDESMSDFTNIIVGDDIVADLGQGTWQLGLRRVLVRTGKYRNGDESRGDRVADETHDSLASWIDHFIANDLNPK
ncbi:predicted sugar phosphatase [Moesziomyces antarcticus T-34]|uniref:Predicted sugar phosphatase n=1 Tax=Pseudozyma antarctica (strain T-34) TaxID=1151754 RepID=M9MBC2_PSEA3|nr:predicted sugar phosphatase [Moesziomyces antarcticus T-34]